LKLRRSNRFASNLMSGIIVGRTGSSMARPCRSEGLKDARSPVAALFVAGAEDKIAPVKDVEQLRALAAPGSELIVLPDATHESVTYFFPALVPPILTWLSGNGGQNHSPAPSANW
jgi:pimeloyl-ACP methyl ester carboxylesterase